MSVSCCFPNTAVRGRSYVSSCGICGERSGAGRCFLRVLLFPLSILIPLIASRSSSEAGTTVQRVAAVPSGLSLAPPQETEKKSEKMLYKSQSILTHPGTSQIHFAQIWRYSPRECLDAWSNTAITCLFRNFGILLQKIYILLKLKHTK
jgi:hypothetical protein